MISRRRPHWLMIAITVLIAMGHICALPGHGEAAPVSSHHDDHEAEPGHVPAGDDSHLESCEGLRSAPLHVVLVPVPAPRSSVPVVTMRSQRSPEPPELVAASPPLFLLHASLLI
jgi:hypothetical protein